MISGSDVQPCIWSMFELCAGITSCCLPTLGPIVTFITNERPLMLRRRIDSESSFGERTNSGNSGPSKPLPQTNVAKPPRRPCRWQWPSLGHFRVGNKISKPSRPFPLTEHDGPDRWRPVPPSPPPFACLQGIHVRTEMEQDMSANMF